MQRHIVPILIIDNHNLQNNMKYKTIAALALSLLVATACVKKEDFDMSNLRVQGDFDPTYGFPLAYFEAHMDTLVEFIRAMDSSDNLYVSVNTNAESGLLTLYAEYHNKSTLDFTSSKRSVKRAARKDGDEPYEIYCTTIRHSNPVKLGRYLIENQIDLKNLFVTFDAALIPNITGTTDSLSKYGVEVYMDTLTMTMDLHIAMTAEEMQRCQESDEYYVNDGDGTKYTKKIPIVNISDGSRLSLVQLAQATSDEARTLRILNNEDISRIIHKDAYRMEISTALSIVATDQAALATIDPSLLTLDDRLFVESMDVKTRAAIEYSALLYVGNMNEIDTIEADCTGLAQYTDKTSYNENGISIALREDDTCNYLVLKAENSMPFNLKLELRGMAEDKRTYVTDNLLKGDNYIESPRVEQVPANIAYTNPNDPVGTAYVANRAVGHSNSELKFPLSSQMLKDLSKAKYLEVKMHIESMSTGAVVDPNDPNHRPYVILREQDMLKLRLFVSAGAHVSINRQLTDK